MNYNMPYYALMPMSRTMNMPLRSASGGLFSRLLGGFNASSILSNTQKTLNLVNQAIPIIKQINPLVKNAKTMFRVMNEFKKIDEVPNSTSSIKDNKKVLNSNLNNVMNNKKLEDKVNTYSNQTDGPVFFIN